MAKTNVERILERYNSAKTIKAQTDHLRADAGKYCWPNAQDQTPQPMSEMYLRTLGIYDSTAMIAAYKLTSGIFSYLMPVGYLGPKWFEFVAQLQEMKDNADIAQWLSLATTLTHTEIWRSNFMREMFITIRSMIVFGTGVISVEMVDGELVFMSHHISTMCFDVNSKGEIDTAYKTLFYTLRQAKQKFGEEALLQCKSIAKAITAKKLDEVFEFVHCTMPNEDYDDKRITSSYKKYRSTYIFIQDKKEVKRSGFAELPYMVARFSRVPGGIMGFGPAMEYLPEISMLNRMKKSFIYTTEYSGNPAMMVEDDGVIGQPVTSPGGTVRIRSGAQFPQPWNPGINVQQNAEVIKNQQQDVRDLFFNSLFQSLANVKNISSATEAQIRKEDDLSIVAPPITALQKEIFSPLIMRVFNLLRRASNSKMPDAPITFDADVVYHGRLALAMSTVQSNAMEQVLAKWAPYAEGTGIFENPDFDKSFRDAWLSAGAPAENLRPYDQMMESRQATQELQAAAAQAEIAAEASKAYKNVNQGIEANSLAEQLI